MSGKKKDDSSDAVASVQSRILDRLAKEVNDAPPTMNRSPELVPLTVEWEATKKKLRLLVTLTKDYAETTRIMHASRSNLVDHLVLLSDKSPIFDSVGKSLDDKSSRALRSICENPSTTKRTMVNQIIDSNDTTKSVETLNLLAATQGTFQERDFRNQIIEYAVEWEKAVTEKVEVELKKVRSLHATRSHYEKKVEQMRQWADDLEKKGKTNPVRKVKKLEENETKLLEAFEVHEKEAGRLCVLLEEATTNSWNDLYHLVKNYCKWESYRVNQESEIYSQLMPATLESMRTAFKRNSNSTKKKKKQKSVKI